MAIDSSIYQNLKPVEMPSMMDSQANAMKLSQVAMQNQASANQLDRDNIAQKQADQKRKLLAVGSTYENVMKLPAEQREEAWNTSVNSLVKDGHLSESDAIPYSEQTAGMIGSQLESNPEWLQIKKAQADLASSKNDPIDRDLARGKTRAEIAKLYSEADKVKNEHNSGKQLAAAQTDNLAGHDASLKMISDLRETLNQNKDNFGPIVGRIKSMSPYSTSGQTVGAMFNKAAQVIGKSLEGGKLTDMDITRYRTMLPNQSDTPSVAEEKLNQIERLVQSRRNSDLETYSKAGLNVGNFSTGNERSIGVMKQANKSGGTIPGFGENATAGSFQTPPPGMILMQSPKGNIKLIPESQKGEAIASGGKVIK